MTITFYHDGHKIKVEGSMRDATTARVQTIHVDGREVFTAHGFVAAMLGASHGEFTIEEEHRNSHYTFGYEDTEIGSPVFTQFAVRKNGELLLAVIP